jgi:hypothetical protein
MSIALADMSRLDPQCQPLTLKPGVVPAVCQYMRNVFVVKIKAQNEFFNGCF